MGRLEGVLFDQIFFHIAEVAYCANINKFYLISHVALDNMHIIRNDSIGPVDEILWCAGRSSLLPDFYVSDNTVDDDALNLNEIEDYYSDAW